MFPQLACALRQFLAHFPQFQLHLLSILMGIIYAGERWGCGIQFQKMKAPNMTALHSLIYMKIWIVMPRWPMPSKNEQVSQTQQKGEDDEEAIDRTAAVQQTPSITNHFFPL
jgi:hypothetical protein